MRGEFLVRRGGPTGTLDEVTPAHGEAPRLADRDVDVLRAREVSLGPKEAIPFVAQVEQAAHGDELAGVLRLLATPLKLALSSTTAGSRRAFAAPPTTSPAVARLVGVGALLHVLTILILTAATLASRRRRSVHRGTGPVVLRGGVATGGLVRRLVGRAVGAVGSGTIGHHVDLGLC